MQPTYKNKRYLVVIGVNYKKTHITVEHGYRFQTIHAREEYSRAEALQVVDWLNGKDQPLARMIAPEYDPYMCRQYALDPPVSPAHSRAVTSEGSICGQSTGRFRCS